MTEGAARGQVCIRANLMRILPICKTPSVLPQGGNPAPSKREPALSVAARHLSRRERQVWIVRKIKAFLPEEGGTAQAVTEGAAHGQVCIRANLMRILPICKTPSVFACGKSSSLEEGASPLCRCATSLLEGETSLDCAEKSKSHSLQSVRLEHVCPNGL